MAGEIEGAQLAAQLRAARLRNAELEAVATNALSDEQRNQMVEAFRIKAERFDLAMSVANDGMYDWDVSSGSIYFDSRYYTMAGYEADEFPGTFEEWARRVEPSDFARVELAVKAYLEGAAQEYDEEFRFRRKTGEWMWIRERVKIVERDNDGAALRVIGTHSDITQRKRAEQEKAELESRLLQAQKMEAIGRLAGGVAHDFNNMLCAIMANSELALNASVEGREVRPFLNEISAASEQAATLTRQLLAFSRKQVIAPKVIDLGDLLLGLRSMLTRLIGEDVNLRIAVADSAWPVLVDPGQVEQIVLNLAINARDAMPDGGEVTIEVSNAPMPDASSRAPGGLAPGNYVELTVSDTGCGMDPETLTNIFEPFFTTKAMDKGTGLGLATVLGVVQQHGGGIDVTSEPGKGSSFQVYLPRARAHVEPVESRNPPKPVGGRETVLVVEDDVLVRDVAASILKSLGYDVLVCSSGADALALAGRHEHSIDLLLTDVVMPGMNGRDLAIALTKQRASLRVLYTSGYDREILDHHGVLEEGGLQLLAKPYSVQSLAARVRAVLDRA